MPPLTSWKEIEMAIDVVDLTAKTGVKIVGTVESWQTPDGDATVEHLAGRDPNGDLLVYRRIPTIDWQVANVSQKTEQKLAGSLSSQ
jgi:hypothetical protein